MSKKSRTCTSPRTGEPLTEYFSEYEAIEGADYVRAVYGTDLVPYRCEKCGHWHLSPKERRTPSRTCQYCLDSRGQPKSLYKTEEDAKRRAAILSKERGLKLKVYRCPFNDGWHLTKKS